MLDICHFQLSRPMECTTLRVKWKESESHSVVSDSLQAHGLYRLWYSPGQNTGVGSLSLFQGIFPTQGPNPDLPHCRRILYQLNHQGNPRRLKWVAYPFSSGSSQTRNWTRVSCIAGRFFLPTELSRKSLFIRVNPNVSYGLWVIVMFSVLGWTKS